MTFKELAAYIKDNNIHEDTSLIFHYEGALHMTTCTIRSVEFSDFSNCVYLSNLPED